MSENKTLVRVEDVEIALGALNGTLHKQLLGTGLVTVAQWNAEIAPRLKGVADMLLGSTVHARSYRVHESTYADLVSSARGEPVAWRYTNKRTGDETFSNQPPTSGNSRPATRAERCGECVLLRNTANPGGLEASSM